MTETQTQQMMNMLLPAGEFVSPKDIAAATGFTPQTINNAIRNNKIAGFAINATRKTGDVMLRKSIPRHCAVLYMARHFTSDAETMTSDLISVLYRLPKQSLAKIHQSAARELARR